MNDTDKAAVYFLTGLALLLGFSTLWHTFTEPDLPTAVESCEATPIYQEEHVPMKRIKTWL